MEVFLRAGCCSYHRITSSPRHHVRSMDLGCLLSSGGVSFAPGHGVCGILCIGTRESGSLSLEPIEDVQRATILESMLVSLPASTYVFYAACF